MKLYSVTLRVQPAWSTSRLLVAGEGTTQSLELLDSGCVVLRGASVSRVFAPSSWEHAVIAPDAPAAQPKRR